MFHGLYLCYAVDLDLRETCFMASIRGRSKFAGNKFHGLYLNYVVDLNSLETCFKTSYVLAGESAFKADAPSS